MKAPNKILRVSWTAKNTNEWVLHKARVKIELLDTVNARKLAYYGHTIRKQGSCLEKEILQVAMSGARRRGRLCTTRMDSIKTWAGLPVKESIRMTEDRDKWRRTSIAWPTLVSRTAKEQNSTRIVHVAGLVNGRVYRCCARRIITVQPAHSVIKHRWTDCGRVNVSMVSTTIVLICVWISQRKVATSDRWGRYNIRKVSCQMLSGFKKGKGSPYSYYRAKGSGADPGSWQSACRWRES